ncbi:MAG: MotA/TolQ/ExbB proton channel family protein [Rhodobacteraceae bacterium]|jgi:biopolymer transport protein ExbB|nr:MotA/TolQ/ExbB proton channel family protein [Paracoccaceae bacterium]
METLIAFLDRGGPAMWAIAALSVLGLALILWKLWRLAVMGLWRGEAAERAVAAWVGGDPAAAIALNGRRGMHARLAAAAMAARADAALGVDQAREETERVARALLAEARSGLRALDLIVTLAPLLGLLGTVLGMIAAFQALEDSGARADPSILAGGIWEALLTTAAGMAVAIPAAAALAFFDGAVERAGRRMEDLATRVFTRAPRSLTPLRAAAE